MKISTYSLYIFLACLMQNTYIYSMKDDILQVINFGDHTTQIFPTPQTWSSFTRQLSRDELENFINKDSLCKGTHKVTIIASGENVPLALDYICRHPEKIKTFKLIDPVIPTPSPDPFYYYRGYFPFSGMPIESLKKINEKPTLEYTQNITDKESMRAIMALFNRSQIPHDTNGTIANTDVEPIQADDTALNNVIQQEGTAWLHNKFMLITLSGIIYISCIKIFLNRA